MGSKTSQLTSDEKILIYIINYKYSIPKEDICLPRVGETEHDIYISCHVGDKKQVFYQEDSSTVIMLEDILRSRKITHNPYPDIDDLITQYNYDVKVLDVLKNQGIFI